MACAPAHARLAAPVRGVSGGGDDDGGDAAEGEEGTRGTGTANRNTS